MITLLRATRRPFSLFTIALLLGGLGLAGCSDEESGGSNTTPAEITAKEAQWNGLGIVDYSLSYRVECLCPTKRVRIEVSNGSIVRSEFDSGDPGTDDSRDDYLHTIPDLFRIVRNAERDAHFLHVKYSDTHGYPYEIRVDQNDNNIDDVETIEVNTFIPR